MHPTLNTNVRNAVLSAVHTEFKSITNRANNVVVTGLKPSNIASDADQFSDLCGSELFVFPSIKSTHRLGSMIEGRIQPLLVTLQSPDDARDLLLKAKLLRNSTSDHVRDRIYINKHMTKAESLAAFNNRKQMRDKLAKKNSSEPATFLPSTSSDTDIHVDPPRSDGSSLASSISLSMTNFPPLVSTSKTQTAGPIYSFASDLHSGNVQQPAGLSSVSQAHYPSSFYDPGLMSGTSKHWRGQHQSG